MTDAEIEKEINEIKNKIALLEKDGNAYLSNCKTKYEDMDQTKNHIKKSVYNKRRELARCLNGDRDVIVNALQDSPKDQLTYQRASAEKCIQEKKLDVWDQVGIMNQMTHQKNMKQKRIEELTTHLNSLKAQEVVILGAGQFKSMSNEDESEQRLRGLSTKLDKVLLKINSARYVNTTYKRMLSFLEKDSLSLPGRLDELEAHLERQKQELQQLRQMAKEAKNSCDDTRRKRSIMEQEIMHDKSSRDKKLTAIRKNLRILQEEADNFNLQPLNLNRKRDLQSRGAGGTAESSNRMTTFGSDRKVQKQALSSALDILKEVVGASKVDDISTSFEAQIHTQKELLDEADKLTQVKKLLIDRLEKAEETIKTSTYESVTNFDDQPASANPSNTQNQTALKKDDSSDNVSLISNLDSQIVLLDENIQKIIDAINVFYRKACVLSNSYQNEEMSYDEKIDLVIDTFSNLSLKYDSNRPTRRDSNVSDKMARILHNSSNTRIELPDPDEENNGPSETRQTARGSEHPGGDKSALFNDEDEEIETTFFSRDDIKKKGKEILNLARPKKNGGGSKKR